MEEEEEAGRGACWGPRADEESYLCDEMGVVPTSTRMGRETSTTGWTCRWLLQTWAVVSFLACWYVIVVSKWMPETGVGILDAIRSDTYYCLLLPYTFLVAIVFISVNWFSMKVFKTA